MIHDSQPHCQLGVPRQRLSAWYDDQLNTPANRQLGEHIQNCIVCKRSIEEFAMLKKKLITHEVTTTPEQNWRGLRMRMLRQPAPVKLTPWRAVAVLLTIALVAILVSQILLPRIGKPTITTVITPGPTIDISNSTTDTQAWGQYPKTTVSLNLPNGESFRRTDISADGKTLIGYILRYNTGTTNFALMSVPSGTVQVIAPYTPQALSNYPNALISGHYAVLSDNDAATSVSHIQYFDLNTHTFLHIDTGALSEVGLALDHDIVILASSPAHAPVTLYALNVVTHAQTVIATNVAPQLQSNVSWPYITYEASATTLVHLYNLETHQDTVLAHSVQAYCNSTSPLILLGTTIVTLKITLTSASTLVRELVTIDHIDTTQPGISVVTTALPQDTTLVDADQRLILLLTPKGTVLWDRAQGRLVNQIKIFGAIILVGDYMLYDELDSVSIIDTRLLPITAP